MSPRAAHTALVVALLAACHREAPTTSNAQPPSAPRPAPGDVTACEGGDRPACRSAALRAIDRRDDAQAFALATRACDDRYLLGCKTLGWLHEMGRGTRRDPARARALYQRACDGGELGACKSLGLLFDTGQGGAVDRARAATLYQRACDHGEADACNNLANLYASGDGVGKDAERALGLFERACREGNVARACENVRALRAERDASTDR